MGAPAHQQQQWGVAFVTRKRFSERDVLLTLIWQGIVIPCFRCKRPISQSDIENGNCEREHLHEIELGGADEPFNCRYSHRDAPCHHTATNGPPSTSAGSSKNRIAKTRPNRADKFVPNKRPLDEVISEPSGRCRKCGQYPDECTCPAPAAKPSGFRRMVRAR